MRHEDRDIPYVMAHNCTEDGSVESVTFRTDGNGGFIKVDERNTAANLDDFLSTEEGQRAVFRRYADLTLDELKANLQKIDEHRIRKVARLLDDAAMAAGINDMTNGEGKHQ